MGIGVIGDSVGAHFSIPEKYVNVSYYNNKDNFNNFSWRVENEFDLPQKSGITGHIEGDNTTSLYKYLVEHNRCNKNDYINLGVNGANSNVTSV